MVALMINGISVALPVIQTGLGSEKTVVTKMEKGNIQVKGLLGINTDVIYLTEQLPVC